MKSSLLHLFFLVAIFLFFSSSSFIKLTASQGALGCSIMFCGEGRCVKSNTSPFGVDCICNPGWKKVEVAGFTFPACILPNCTVDLSCGNTPPEPPTFPPQQNCDFVWCDQGQCVTNGTGHICQCNQGADNLFGNPQFLCLNQCSLGSDCQNVVIGAGSSPPPPSNSASRPTGGPSTTRAGRRLVALAIMFLSAVFITWI